MCIHLYANDYNSEVPCAGTSGRNTWVDHNGGALRYFNLNRDPDIEEEQKEAIRRGLLWPYSGGKIGLFRCSTTRYGNARSYSMPDSFYWEPQTFLINTAGTNKNMYVKKLGFTSTIQA